MSLQQRTILFTGHVQGVGFRYTAVQFARDLDLSGSVRNLPHGQVELIVEGDAVEIDTLVNRLREHFDDLIRTVEQTNSPPTGLSGGVRVTY